MFLSFSLIDLRHILDIIGMSAISIIKLIIKPIRNLANHLRMVSSLGAEIGYNLVSHVFYQQHFSLSKNCASLTHEIPLSILSIYLSIPSIFFKTPELSSLKMFYIFPNNIRANSPEAFLVFSRNDVHKDVHMYVHLQWLRKFYLILIIWNYLLHLIDYFYTLKNANIPKWFHNISKIPEVLHYFTKYCEIRDRFCH